MNKPKSIWQKYLTLITSLLLTTTIFTYPSSATNIIKLELVESSTPNPNWQKKQSEYQLVHASGNCRQVRTRSGLYVFDKPSITGSVVGFLDYGQNVTIKNLGKDGFVPISSPIQGYVFAEFLNLCKFVTPTLPSFCRIAIADNGIVVRRKPSINAARVGVIPKARSITINSRGRNGWVETVLPLRGYVQSKYLGYCPEAL
jgi:hypothetical protein